MRFIRKLLTRFEGDIVKTLRYYNAGNNYDEYGESYDESIKYEYTTMVSLYVKDDSSYGNIYRKEAF